MPEHYDINSRDFDTDDIIAKPPSWLIRNGMILIIALLISLIVMAHFISYPDTVRGNGIMQRHPAPARIGSPINGKVSINVSDSVFVRAYDTIATLNDSLKLISPIDGYIYFARKYDKVDHVEKDETLFAILPEIISHSIQIFVLPKDVLYVKEGQDCLISIEEYPSQTYGFLEGKVTSINNLFSDSLYTVNLQTDTRLVTSKMIEIPVMDKYFINASIVFGNRSVLERIIRVGK